MKRLIVLAAIILCACSTPKKSTNYDSIFEVAACIDECEKKFNEHNEKY